MQVGLWGVGTVPEYRRPRRPAGAGSATANPPLPPPPPPPPPATRPPPRVYRSRTRPHPHTRLHLRRAPPQRDVSALAVEVQVEIESNVKKRFIIFQLQALEPSSVNAGSTSASPPHSAAARTAAPAGRRAPCPPDRRVIENKHSNRDLSMTYLQCDCSYGSAVSARRFNVGRMLVLRTPLPGVPLAHHASAPPHPCSAGRAATYSPVGLARQVIGCQFTQQNEGSKCVSMPWRALGLADVARQVIGCQLTQETRVQMR
jgi:hypothetical protein